MAKLMPALNLKPTFAVLPSGSDALTITAGDVRFQINGEN
jgi:hypothetical protein